MNPLVNNLPYGLLEPINFDTALNEIAHHQPHGKIVLHNGELHYVQKASKGDQTLSINEMIQKFIVDVKEQEDPSLLIERSHSIKVILERKQNKIDRLFKIVRFIYEFFWKLETNHKKDVGLLDQLNQEINSKIPQEVSQKDPIQSPLHSKLELEELEEDDGVPPPTLHKDLNPPPLISSDEKKQSNQKAPALKAPPAVDLADKKEEAIDKTSSPQVVEGFSSSEVQPQLKPNPKFPKVVYISEDLSANIFPQLTEIFKNKAVFCTPGELATDEIPELGLIGVANEGERTHWPSITAAHKKFERIAKHVTVLLTKNYNSKQLSLVSIDAWEHVPYYTIDVSSKDRMEFSDKNTLNLTFKEHFEKTIQYVQSQAQKT